MRRDRGCRARGGPRSRPSITRIVVTKFHPASLVRELVRARRARRRREPAPGGAGQGRRAGRPRRSRWHFVGQLQSNKAQAGAAPTPTWSTRSTRPSLVDALGRARRRPLDCFLELNLTDDPGRGGVGPGRPSRPRRAGRWPRRALRLRGVMAVAPARRGAAARVRPRPRGLASASGRRPGRRPAISAGMSADLRRRDRRRRDTPAHRHGNHGKTSEPRLISNTDAHRLHGGCDGEPAAQDDGLSRPGRRGLRVRGSLLRPQPRPVAPAAHRGAAKPRTGHPAAPPGRSARTPRGRDERDPDRAPAPVPRRAGRSPRASARASR